MINLAPLRYRNIFSHDGGPVDKIEYSRRSIGYKREGFEAYCYLSSQFRNLRTDHCQIYGNADGSGSGQTKLEASYKAISEAMERWAFFQSIKSNQSHSLGFDIDASTAGIAAFPGLFKMQARRLAYYEALERWAIRSWWEGALPAQKVDYLLGIEAWEILTPLREGKVVLLSRQESGFWIYGFSGGRTFEAAALKAEVELERNAFVLNEYYLKNKSNVIDLSISEQRLVYFSTEEGHNRFCDVMASKPSHAIELPRLVIDIEIVGPWSQYCVVWRCLFNQDHNIESTSHKFFLF